LKTRGLQTGSPSVQRGRGPIAFIAEPGPIRKMLTPVLPHTERRASRAASAFRAASPWAPIKSCSTPSSRKAFRISTKCGFI